PRLHRLPQRLDYTLIPAPLDLSIPTIAEKSPLPAIIVTPSSPSATHNYSIAFLAPPQKPTLFQRLVSHTPFAPAPADTFPPSPPSTPSTPSKSKPLTLSFSQRLSSFQKLTPNINLKFRTFFILSLILFVMLCHLITHKLASRRPHLDFPSPMVVGAIQHQQLQQHGSGSQAWLDNFVPDDGNMRERQRGHERDFLMRGAHHVNHASQKGESDAGFDADTEIGPEGEEGEAARIGVDNEGKGTNTAQGSNNKDVVISDDVIVGGNVDTTVVTGNKQQGSGSESL
ncbi:hypothetical protein K435DRAFT_704659, partial [Dendrothele bispora CBS 962.96]